MSQASHLIIQAEQAMQAYEWEKAQALYQQALALEPNTPRAEVGLRHAQQAVTKEVELEERIAAADALLAAGRYQEAAREYPRIMEYAVDTPRILKFHTRLEQGRNQAKDLEAWRERVQRALQEAQALKAKGNLDAAAKKAEDMLHQLPQSSIYAPLTAALEKVRDDAIQQSDQNSLYNKAIEVLKAKDLERGIELLEMIPANSQVASKAQPLLNQMREHQNALNRDLSAIDTALAEGRPTDAWAELENRRERYAEFPRWKRLYLQAGTGYGRALLEEGRQLNTRRDFVQARKRFASAQSVFDKVLALYPAHPDAQSLRDECADLTTIAEFEAQAQAEENAGRRDTALTAWKQALQRLDYAKGEGRDYASARAVVEVELNRLDEEIKRIRVEERNLRDAESLWEHNHLAEARQRYAETLDALLPEHQKQAAEGLRRVEAKIRQFDTLLARGDGLSDPVAASHAYQEAYDLWSEGPEVGRRLESALVNACETALAAGRATEAVGYGQHALALNPDNREAKRCVDKAGVKPRVEATLENVRNNLAMLQRQDEIYTADLLPMLNELEAILREAGPWPDLCTQLEALHQEVRSLRDQWQQYERHYERALRYRDTGEWRDALETLDEGIATLGSSAPSGVRNLRSTWERLAKAFEQGEREATAALEKARAAYDAAAGVEHLSDIGDALEMVWRELEPAQKRLENIKEQIQAANAPFPTAMADLQKQIVELNARATAAIEAVTAFSASDGLLRIQEAIKMRTSDPTLEAVQAQLKARAGEMLVGIKQQAQTAIQAGDLTEAEEKLRQVRELDPGDAETAQLYAEIRQRRALEEKLRQIERDADSKLASNSPADAMKTLRQALNAVLEPEVNLPPRAREVLSALVALGDRDDGLALGQAENWQTAQDLTAELGSLRSENWVAGRAVPLLDQWIRLARDNALRGVVASAAQLGNLLQAYRAAAAYLKAHPTEQFAIQQLTERQESLINQLNDSANKRIHRAQTALDDGDFEIALHNLRDIEADFYQPIEQEFPGLLDGYDEVQEVRDEVVHLQAEAEKLQALYTQTQPQLETARLAYQNSQWDAAEKALESLPELKDVVPDLYAQVETLRAQIVKGRKDSTRTQVQTAMSRVETGRNLATTTEQLDAYLEELKALQAEINVQLLDVDERNRYFNLLTEVSNQREALAAGAMWEEKIAGYLAEGNYQEALNALDEALAVTREAARIVDLKSRRNRIAQHAQEQAERAMLFAQGQALFAEGKYIEARAQFTQAKQKGAEVAGWLDAARAGALLISARRLWDEERDGENALADLDELADIAKDNLYTDPITEEARRLRRKIKNALEGTLEVQRALAEVRRLLMDNDFQAARASIQKLLEREPKNKEALALQMLIDAREAQVGGEHSRALSAIETVLGMMPEFPEALRMKRELEAVTEAGKAIVRVEMLAKDQKFREARELLTKLAEQNIDPDKLRTMQKMIEDLEKDQWDKVVHPIEDLYREGEYAEALNRCRQAFERTATPELRDELAKQQNGIVNRWAEKQAQSARAQLQKRPEDEQLREIEAQLNPFLTLDPAPEGHLVRQIEDLLRETRTRRLRGRVAQARARYEAWIADGGSGTPQAALDLIGVVQKEAETLGTQVDFDITLDAAALETEIQETLRQREEVQRQNKRDTLLEQARSLQAKLEDPTYIAQKSPGRADLERVAEWAKSICRIPGYENDALARELETWAHENIRAFDRTQQALAEAQTLVGKRRFRDAEYELRSGGTVSLLLKGLHDRWRELIATLRRAETDQNNEAWDAALRGYLQIVQTEPGLESLVEREMERCYQNLGERVQETVSQALSQTPPDIDVARAALEQAETSGWIVSPVSREYEYLRGWLRSQEHVARAAALLQAEEGDLDKAVEALREARRLLPREQSDDAIRQWESLSEALLAWRAYEQRPGLLPRALDTFRALQAPISTLARVQESRRQLEEETERRRSAAEQEAEQRRLAAEEAAERQRLLATLEKEVNAALATSRDYPGAARALENASPKIAGEPGFVVQHTRVVDDLRAAIQSAIKEWRYARALELADILKRVPHLAQETKDWIVGLPAERRAALNAKLQEASSALKQHDEAGVLAALKDAELIAEGETDERIADMYARLQADKLEITLYRGEQALENYTPGEVETAIKEARQLAGDSGDPRITVLEDNLRALRRLLDNVHTNLREVNVLIGQKQWAAATERLFTTRNDAPRYQRVMDAIHDLQNRLAEQAEIARKAGEFAQGVNLCDMALRLERRDDLYALQQQIRVDQEAALVDLRKQIHAGLDAWRLEPVPDLLQRGLYIAPNDTELLALQERYNAIDAKLDSIRQTMIQGWDALQARDHTTAIAAFERVLATAPQPLPDVQLWRNYARDLREAARIAQEGTDFSQTVQLLRDAENLMYVNTEQSLPDIFSSAHHLYERHRHAVYNAWRLRQSARKMEAWYRDSDAYYARGDSKSMEEGMRLFDLVVAEQASFKRLYLNPTVPPDAFPATGQVDEPLPAVAGVGSRSGASSGASVPPKPEPRPAVSTSPPAPKVEAEAVKVKTEPVPEAKPESRGPKRRPVPAEQPSDETEPEVVTPTPASTKPPTIRPSAPDTRTPPPPTALSNVEEPSTPEEPEDTLFDFDFGDFWKNGAQYDTEEA